MSLAAYRAGLPAYTVAFDAQFASGAGDVYVAGPLGFTYLLDSIAIRGLGGNAGIFSWGLFVADDNAALVTPTGASGDPIYQMRGTVAAGEAFHPKSRHNYPILLYPRRYVTRAPTYLKLFLRSGSLNHACTCIVTVIPDVS
jgi:hypothetical protein